MYSNLENEYKSKIIELETQNNLLRSQDKQLINENAHLRAQNSKFLLEKKEMSNSLPEQPNLQPPLSPVPQAKAPLSRDQSFNPPPSPVPQASTSPSGTQSLLTPITPSKDYANPEVNSTIKRRQCPQCGAFGFAIRECVDKTKIISYIPRTMYAKKRVCTKCMHEF